MERGDEIASFPGLPTVQFLQAIKNWTVGMPGNEARDEKPEFVLSQNEFRLFGLLLWACYSRLHVLRIWWNQWKRIHI